MNTIKSVYYGWGTLIVAGGGAYYFAKKSINTDRAAKAEAEHKKRIAQYQLEQAHFNPPSNNGSSSSSGGGSGGLPKPSAQSPINSSISSTPPSQNTSSSSNSVSSALLAKKREEESKGKVVLEEAIEAGNPSQEASQDPAPTRHEPEDEGQKMREKSKYEASDVYRSRKGDRFS